jgi:hypothetical protein
MDRNTHLLKRRGRAEHAGTGRGGSPRAGRVGRSLVERLV